MIKTVTFFAPRGLAGQFPGRPIRRRVQSARRIVFKQVPAMQFVSHRMYPIGCHPSKYSTARGWRITEVTTGCTPYASTERARGDAIYTAHYSLSRRRPDVIRAAIVRARRPIFWRHPLHHRVKFAAKWKFRSR